MTEHKTERKKALVTGGATGIGRAAVLALAKAGYDVAINYGSSAAAAKETAAEAAKLGAQTLTLQCDVSDEPAVRAMMKTIEAAFGHLDVLVNNAAAPRRRPVQRLTTDELDETMRLNFTSPVRMAMSQNP